MTRETKLQCHLERIIFEDLAHGTALNAKQVYALMAVATPEQKQRAFERGLQRIPLLLDDERGAGAEGNWNICRDEIGELREVTPPVSRILCLPCGKLIFRRKVPKQCKRCGASVFMARAARADEVKK